MARAFLGSTPSSSPLIALRLSSFTPSFITNQRRRSLRPTTAAVVAMTELSSEKRIQPHPSLEVIGGGSDRFLPAFKDLDLPYKPFPVIGSNRHLETIFASFFRTCPNVKLRRECLRAADNGTVALDWVAGDDLRLPLDSPVLILLVCAYWFLVSRWIYELDGMPKMNPILYDMNLSELELGTLYESQFTILFHIDRMNVIYSIWMMIAYQPLHG